jgi:hypothetical protein
MIQALIPLVLQAVEDALQQEVLALAGPRYAHADGRPAIARWGSQAGSVFLADQKVPIHVPRVRNRAANTEVPLATYTQLQTPRGQDVGLFRRVLGGLSCRDDEAAAEAVPEAFGLAKSSVSRRFVRASAKALQTLHESLVTSVPVKTTLDQIVGARGEDARTHKTKSSRTLSGPRTDGWLRSDYAYP